MVTGEKGKSQTPTSRIGDGREIGGDGDWWLMADGWPFEGYYDFPNCLFAARARKRKRNEAEMHDCLERRVFFLFAAIGHWRPSACHPVALQSESLRHPLKSLQKAMLDRGGPT